MLADKIIDIYGVGFDFWNNIAGMAMGMFKDNPKTWAEGLAFDTMLGVYKGMKSVLIPLMVGFFFIKLLKELLSAPWEQVYRKFLTNVAHFAIMLVIILNLWDITGMVIDVASVCNVAIIKATENGSKTRPNIDKGEEKDNNNKDAWKMHMDKTFKEKIEEICSEGKFVEKLIANILLLIVSAFSAGIFIMSSFSILKFAYVRLLKPLIMLPFAGLAVALSVGTEKMAQTTFNFYKSIVLFCLSGAYMSLCLCMAKFLTNIAWIQTAEHESFWFTLSIMIAQGILTPTIISGLIKEAMPTLKEFS